MALSDDLRSEALKLFNADRIDVFIGFQAGTVPFKSMPAFFKSAAELETMVFDNTCANNLAVYVKRFAARNQRVGIAAVGCVGRSLVELLKQNQIKRENLVIIGIECGGVIDARKADGAGDNPALKELTADPCHRCGYRVPPVADTMLKGMDRIYAEVKDPYGIVARHAGLKEAERWEIFRTEMSKCIRCYACRQVCPVCFCETCFVDRSDPQIVGLTDDPTDAAIFQMTRFLHVAGRCVDCGACERACPADVDLGLFRLKIEKDVKDMYGFESGLDVDQGGVMTSFDLDDTEDFMLDVP